MMNFNCCELSAFTSVNPQTIITVEKHKQWVTAEMAFSRQKWWYQCTKFGANGGIYSEKEDPQRGSPTARVTGGANGGIYSAKEGPLRGRPTARVRVSGGGYGVHRRWLWRSPAVAVGWGIFRAQIGRKTEGERREESKHRNGRFGGVCFGPFLFV
ncbi:Uncharacterized protein Fot_38311 [Forsythia ovata]|uniref:Uncharacterized protein n=1 Tax=Forsythia ovata TaxID=205694 RepID=A0ABD1S1F7_9LAMI